MVKKHPTYLDSCPVVFSCITCHTQLVNQQDIVSRAFQGRHGSAFLVEKAVNTFAGKQEERLLMTGIHTVADILCQTCHANIGWIYLRAPEANQKYKEGKYAIERTQVIKECLLF